MQNPTCCSSCGASLLGRWEYITKGQLNTLAKFREAIIQKGTNSIHLQKEIELTKNEYNNFQKLRYNALVAHAPETGCWLLTRRGAQFLRNEAVIPKGVLIFRNRIQKYHKDKVDMMDIVKNDEPYWFTREDYSFETVDIADYELNTYENIVFDDKGQGTMVFD